MRQGKVFYQNHLQGRYGNQRWNYTFEYDNDYIQNFRISSLPFQCRFPRNYIEKIGCSLFFEGLIPEGWLLEIASESWKINKNDRMGFTFGVLQKLHWCSKCRTYNCEK